jgi:hypothetical protein
VLAIAVEVEAAVEVLNFEVQRVLICYSKLSRIFLELAFGLAVEIARTAEGRLIVAASMSRTLADASFSFSVAAV